MSHVRYGHNSCNIDSLKHASKETGRWLLRASGNQVNHPLPYSATSSMTICECLLRNKEYSFDYHNSGNIGCVFAWKTQHHGFGSQLGPTCKLFAGLSCTI